jgi:hypothetical protein
VSRGAVALFRGVLMIRHVDFDAQRDILSLRYACFRSRDFSS